MKQKQNRGTERPSAEMLSQEETPKTVQTQRTTIRRPKVVLCTNPEQSRLKHRGQTLHSTCHSCVCYGTVTPAWLSMLLETLLTSNKQNVETVFSLKPLMRSLAAARVYIYIPRSKNKTKPLFTLIS